MSGQAKEEEETCSLDCMDFVSLDVGGKRKWGLLAGFQFFLSPSPQAHSMPRGWSTASAEKDEEEEEEEKEEEVQDAQEI